MAKYENNANYKMILPIERKLKINGEEKIIINMEKVNPHAVVEIADKNITKEMTEALLSGHLIKLSPQVVGTSIGIKSETKEETK